MTVLLLVLLALVTALAAATLLSVRAMRRRLESDLESTVRRAVAVALAEDREREIAEARSFWAEQEARAAEESVDNVSVDDLTDLNDLNDLVVENTLFLPAPRGFVDGAGEMDPEFADALRSALEEMITEGDRVTHPRHPAEPGFIPQPTPTPEWTDLRLLELVEVGTVLKDVRPGPMGTLDVYVFEDDTTLCVAPGDAETGARIREAVADGTEVRLLGTSRLPGAHALTFALSDDETVYVLADRVVASL
ncbi:hypothetical protein [Streptacidiphilus jiangxiensis]|uniref:Secreted protein n=1 Tax=Streptacidiphilus jiangxiensis TaxID=235985 RepID=A0A1H7FLZ2_STRJI|nr:hypothetical protein [Streptacidiphilus jiangxiensis]SEK25462.1 hypothetical protein SAMN05414137_101261 [Streptacidiphilus jiangxiensis]